MPVLVSNRDRSSDSYLNDGSGLLIISTLKSCGENSTMFFTSANCFLPVNRRPVKQHRGDVEMNNKPYRANEQNTDVRDNVTMIIPRK